MPNPINGTQIRRNNIITILKAVKENGPIAKRDLQRLTGLSWGAVSTISSVLTSYGYLNTIGKQVTTFGRKPEELDVSDTNYYILGVDFNISSGICGVVTDMKGRIVREYKKVNVPQNYEGAMQALYGVLDGMVADYADHTILGIGIAQQGFVDAQQGVSLYFPHVKGWSNVPLRELVEKRYNCYAQLMHDPNCVLIAEKHAGESFMSIAENAVLVRIDGGIGLSLMLGSEIYEGNRGQAGEFGHVTMDPDGPVCACGKRGCLGAYASMDGMLCRFREHVQAGETTAVAADCRDIAVLAEAARRGDGLCRRVFAEMGEKLGLALSNLFNTFCPEIVILYGLATAYQDLFFDALLRSLNTHIYSTISAKVQISSLGTNAPALGAALTVSDRVLERIALLVEDENTATEAT